MPTQAQFTPGAVTHDHLLGGRVAYRQPRAGLRAAIDPILLAAAIPAQPGECVLEGGTGAGAALLCLAARVAGVQGVGLDRDPSLLALARQNAAANGWPGLSFIAADVAASPIAGPPSGAFDHVFANPPYHPGDGTRSPFPARESAKRIVPGSLDIWARALAGPLRDRGTLTLILPPALLEPALAAMRAAHVPAGWLLPVWPKSGRNARLLLLQGRKHGRSPLVLAAGLILHTENGAFRPEAEAILRDGAALPLKPA